MSLFRSWKQDLPAGLVVFLVAVPLCLGIALASEAPLFAGLIAGIIGGVVVGFFSGASIGVSGPAAGLSAIVATSIQDLGSFEVFLAAVVLMGFFQLIFGIIRLGYISFYFPNVVIKGMLAAIGLIIILKQLPHAIGYDKDFEGDEAFFQVDGQNTFSEIVNSLNFITPSALIITLCSMALLIFWDSKRVQSSFIGKIPGPLLVVILGIVFTISLQGSEWALIPEHRVDLGIAGKSIGDLFLFPDFSHWNDSKLYTIAITLAVVASLETLLSVDAADKLDPKKRITPSNRELLAQGIGNMVSGSIGGLPITQVVVRSSANVNSGGTSKLSTIFHGLLIAVSVITIPQLFGYVPYASLASILFLVGYKLAKPSLFKKVFKEGWIQFIPFIATIVGILFTDLLKGIGIGMAISFIVILYHNLKLSTEIIAEGKNYRIRFSEHMTFLNKASLRATLLALPANVHVIIDQSDVKYMAHDIAESIEDFLYQAEEKNITVEIISSNYLNLINKKSAL